MIKYPDKTPRRIQRKIRKTIRVWQAEILSITLGFFNQMNKILDDYKGGSK